MFLLAGGPKENIQCNFAKLIIMVSPNSKARQQLKKWRANALLEQRKLHNSPTCKLAGSGSSPLSRTRKKRIPFSSRLSVVCNEGDIASVSPSLQATPRHPERLFFDPLVCTPISTLTPDVSVSSGRSRKAPEQSRVIVESQPLAALMERHIRCPDCGSSVKVSFPSKMIASTIRIDCIDQSCGFVDLEKPTAASPELPEGSRNIKRNSDAAINILFVMAFLSKGDGGTEAAHLLGLLGLPNATTMSGSSFGSMEKQIGPSVLQKLADDVVYKHQLIEEVKLSYGDKEYHGINPTFSGRSLFELWKEGKLKEESDLWPRVTVSADMGWQGRSSGHVYNSLSGDALLVGALTRKPIAWYVSSRCCGLCNGWARRQSVVTGEQQELQEPDVPQHKGKCQKNWNGSAGAMEPIAVLEMVKHLYDEFHVAVEKIVTDDDSSMKAKLKWTNEDTMINKGLDELPFVINNKGKKVLRPDKGELPATMEEPTFVADPNHRKKSFGGELYRLTEALVENKATMTKMDMLRLMTNFAYMVRTLPSKPRETWADSAKAVIEHHFDNHNYCGDWCCRKNLTDADKDAKKKMYRSKEKDPDLYKILLKKIERFITDEALDEVGHGMDTLMNESFNNTVAWAAPKNKVYSSTDSLKNRIAICLGINGLGTFQYYKTLFERLDIPLTPNVEHYLKLISNRRATKILKSKTAAAKKKRQAKYQLKLLAKTVVAKRERAKREGTYKTGMGIDGGYTEEELSKAKEMFPSDFKVSAAMQRRAATVCKFCFQVGHKTNRSKACPQHAAWLASKGQQSTDAATLKDPPAAARADDDAAATPEQEADDTEMDQAERDAAECNLMDQIPLVDDVEDPDADNDIFEVLQLDCVLSDLGKEDDDDDLQEE